MHSDAQTNAPDTEYFFLGDGQISAAIQWSRNPQLSPYGILLMNPEGFSRKESTLLFHPDFGLSRTMLSVTVDGVRYAPQHEDVQVSWESTDPLFPIVGVKWKAGEVTLLERFGIQRIERVDLVLNEDGIEEEHQWFDSFLVRDIRMEFCDQNRNGHAPPEQAAVELGFYPNPYIFESLPLQIRDQSRFAVTGYSIFTMGGEPEAEIFERFITARRDLHPGRVHPIVFSYHLPTEQLDIEPLDLLPFDLPGERPETGCYFSQRLMRQFDIARIGLNAVVSHEGHFDASVWQYGYEWGQDAAMVASAAVHAGEFDIAEALISRLLTTLSNAAGQIAESSRFRDGEIAELNANGAVLLALRDYVALTGDLYHLEKYWHRIVAIAELPLQEPSLHPSGLIVGRRDLWERFPWMGLRRGFDTATNTFCAEGLIAAAELAEMIGSLQSAKRWREAGERIRREMIGHEHFSCIEEERIIHRRLLDGSVQRQMIPEARYNDERYAPYVPSRISDRTPRECDPDSTSALPIVYGIVDPSSSVADHTLTHLREQLWDVTGIGGYARSPLSSDPDSPGPWPFVTAWMGEAELRCGKLDKAEETTEWLLKMAGEGGSWFEYYGLRESPPFPPVGIIVWGWAQYILLVLRGWMGVEVNTEQICIAPKMTCFEHSFRVGEHIIDLVVAGTTEATIDGETVPLRNGGVILNLPLQQSHHIEFSSDMAG